MKKLLALVLICMFTINLVSFEAMAKTKSFKRSFSKPSQQSTIKYKPIQRNDQVKATKKPVQQPPANSQPKSNFLRNIGLLAGGMMLGGLLASFFGGSPFLANIFGMLFNVILLMLVLWIFLAAIGFLWRKIRGKQQQNNFNRWNKYDR